MTYYGSTQGTTLANPPLEMACGVGGQVLYPGDLTTSARGSRVWLYNSTNPLSELRTAGFFTDGARLGMLRGDFIFCVMNGGAATTDAVAFRGILNSTESSLATGAYNLTSST